MALLVLRGNYTPRAWAGIRENPEQAPQQIEACLERVAGTLQHYFFSLDQYDFYCFVQVPAAGDVGVLRHLLFVRGDFAALEAEVLMRPDELLPRLRELYDQAKGISEITQV
jgi:uncharacterized protein with GYD domain